MADRRFASVIDSTRLRRLSGSVTQDTATSSRRGLVKPSLAQFNDLPFPFQGLAIMAVPWALEEPQRAQSRGRSDGFAKLHVPD